MNPDRFDILLSYQQRDWSFAEALARQLQEASMKVWLDRWSISPGELFTDALYRGLTHSDSVGVCIGPESNDDLQLDKLVLAHKQNPSQIVLPILVRGATPDNVPAELKALGPSRSISQRTEEIVYKLIDTLLTLEALPAVAYLLQETLTETPGLFTRLKDFLGKPFGATGEKAHAETADKQLEPSPDIDIKPLTETAKQILRGHVIAPKDALRIAGELKRVKQFGYARRILARARISPDINKDRRLRLLINQQLALCTYKDPGLLVDDRLDRALEILRESADLETTVDQETLGLAGAIFKRKWEVDNQKQQLERSFNYYLRGYKEGPAHDQGYTGINAAFILDLLANQEEEEAKKAEVFTSEIASQRRSQARDIRQDIINQVAPLIEQPDTNWLQGKWWFYSTVAEAYFGLGEYDDAIQSLRRGKVDAEQRQIPVAPWEHESTARQLAALARLQTDTDKALSALSTFFDKQEVESAYIGKIGLGLSGGGFRASLFHIGVLARLAELDVLRRVEVLSCVSGGAIVGAHYYLEVRQLLQTKPDHEVTRQDYIDIVARVRKDFLAGVQRNVRTRVALNPLKTLRMLFRSEYSRTMRAGELYEKEIFSRVKDDEFHGVHWLDGLYIFPVDEAGRRDNNFNLKTDNWRRQAKVPNLILNTAALNTGHNWQFTASWMGEPAANIDSEIDGNDRLRRLYYDSDDTPGEYRHIPLGHAVAASACVPGIFEPLPLDKLYPQRVVRLVDGGVCDNQGVGSLLEQDCNVILVSDGSGQMESQNDPGIGLLGVPLRSNTILQARVREAQYRELIARRRASLLRGFMFVHLKEDLDVDPIDWIGCLDPYDASDDSRPAYRRGPLTRYGIAKELQELLAGVRTDLDSFTDVEAFALMTSGYRMTEFNFSKCIEGFSNPAEQYPWDFLAVEEGMKGVGPKYDYLKKQLKVSNMLAFKIWKLSLPLRIGSWVLAIGAVLAAIWLSFRWGDQVILNPITVWQIGSGIAILLATALATYLIGKKLMHIVRLRETLISIVIYLVTALVGWLAAGIHLLLFDPWFLRRGSLERFKKAS